MSIHTAEWISKNISEMLLILALTGALTGIWRWRNAARKDFLTSFIVFLLFTSLREVPVYIGGMVNWSVDLVILSATARIGQIVGAIMFIGASLKSVCPPQIWCSFVVVAALIAWGL